MASQQTPSKKLMVVYFLGFLYLGMGIGLTGPTVPYLAEQVGVHLDTISYVFIASSIGGILGALVGARGFDRWAGHKIMGVAILFSAVFKFLIPLTSNFLLLLPLFFFLVFSHITYDTGGNTLLIWWWGKKVGPYMNAMHLMFGVGAILSPLLVAQTLKMTGEIRWAYWGIALLGIPLSLLIFSLPSPEIPAKENGENGEMQHGQMTLIWLFVLLFVLYVGGEVGFSNWVYTYATKTGLANSIQAAYLTSLFWGGLTIGRLISIPLLTRFRIEQMLWVSVLGAIGSAALMLLIPPSIWVGAALLGLSYASIFPLTVSWAASTMAISGKINGWLFAGANLGAMIFPWMIGQFFVAISPIVLLWAIVLLGLGMVGAMVVLQRKIKQSGSAP